MDRKRAMCSVITTLLGLAMFGVLPINAQGVICPWCNTGMQSSLLDCLYAELISQPALFRISLQDIDHLKGTIKAYSDSVTGLPYEDKKVAVDKEFVNQITLMINQNNYQTNPAVTSSIFASAGSCYSSVTGYDPSVINRDMKAMSDDINRNAAPAGGNLNPQPNSGVPYPANQNQPSNFPPSQPQIQPFNNPPFNPPISPPVNSFNNNPPVNNAPFNPPTNSFNNNPPVNNAPLNSPRPAPGNSFNNNPPVINAPLNSPRTAPVNSFNNNPPVNNAPLNSPRPAPVNSFNKNPPVNNAPLNYPASSLINPPNNPSFVNGDSGPSEKGPSSDYQGQGQATTDSSNNQPPPGDSQGSFIQNDKESQGYKNSPDNDTPASTVSPKVSSPSQDSKSTDADSSDNSNVATTPPNTDPPQKKTTADEKSEDEVPCDEKFKIALYDKLINDGRFCTFFEKLPISETKPEVPKIMKHAFKKYGIEQHDTEYSTFWRFESKTLDKESSAEDWDEVISKILKIIFSRNNLLKDNCEEAGKKMGDYILDTFPGDAPSSSTENTNQDGGNASTDSEALADSNSSVQESNSASNSTANASADKNSNFEKSKNLSFPDLHSKLKNILKNGGSTEGDGDKAPFSELLSAFEKHETLEKLYSAAESSVSPSGMDFDKFYKAMSGVTKKMQENHPDWTLEECQKEMYAATVVVLTKLLNDKSKSSIDDSKTQSSSDQSDSAVDVDDSQSSDYDSQPEVPQDYYPPSDDSEYPATETDYDPGDSYQPPQDYSDYDGTGPVNIPAYDNQPGPSDRNSGLQQPSNFAPGPVSTDYRDSSNGNLQNPPFAQQRDQILPTSMNPQLYSGNQPSPNAGFRQPPPNFAPDSGGMNPSNGNFGNSRFQPRNVGNDYGFGSGPSAAQPVLPNGNSQNFSPPQNQGYNPSVPASGPVAPNGNSGNFSPQLNRGFNSGAPISGPLMSTGNSGNFPPQRNRYDSGVPAPGPVAPNYNNRPRF